VARQDQPLTIANTALAHKNEQPMLEKSDAKDAMTNEARLELFINEIGGEKILWEL
jgi:hypothetical protein